MSLYAAAISALRDIGSQTEVGLWPAVVRHDTPEHAEQAALHLAREDLFPAAEGWRDHRAFVMSIEDVTAQRIWYEQVKQQQEEGGMTTRYIDVENMQEGWELQTDRFCPACGTRGVWLLESAGTYNNNNIGLCLACDTAWEWTYFSEEWVKARALRLRAIGRDRGAANA